MKAVEEKKSTLYKKGINSEGKSFNVDTLFSLRNVALEVTIHGVPDFEDARCGSLRPLEKHMAVADSARHLRCPSNDGLGMLYAVYTRDVSLVYVADVEIGVSRKYLPMA